MRAALLTSCLAASLLSSSPVSACGDSEAGLSCDDDGKAQEQGARYMLQRVSKALAADKVRALESFVKGTEGFRTADTYVFCVGLEGTFTAHPNPILQGHDALGLHDKAGNYFIRTMVDLARPGEVLMIHYLFPKPGSTVEEGKTTYYTKAGDQVCGVGVYDTDVKDPGQADPEARVTALRQKLDGEIPAKIRADWTAFLEALNAQTSARETARRSAYENLRAAEAALAPPSTR